MSSGGFAAPLTELVPHFERTTHKKVVIITTSMGLGQNSIPNRVRKGEAVDVVILPDEDLKMLAREGLVIGSTRVALANSSIGMAVRSGAPKPDSGFDRSGNGETGTPRLIVSMSFRLVIPQPRPQQTLDRLPSHYRLAGPKAGRL